MLVAKQAASQGAQMAVQHFFYAGAGWSAGIAGSVFVGMFRRGQGRSQGAVGSTLLQLSMLP